MQQILTPRGELAHALSLSETRVAALLHAGILPKKTRAGYDLIQSVRAYIHYLRTNTHSTLAAERTRLTKARADRAEMDLKVRAGELVEVWQVKKDVFACARATRDAVQALPDRLAGVMSAEMDQTRCHTILTKEIRQALSALTA